MSQIRAVLFRLRATIVLVAVAAVFGGALFFSPHAHATAGSAGVIAPCDHNPATIAGEITVGKTTAPVKRANSAGHCPDCCLFGGVGALALPVRASFVIQPRAEIRSLAFDVAVVDGATELLLSGAANGARAPPVVAI